MAFCRSLFIYLLDGPGTNVRTGVEIGTRAWAGVGIKAWEMASICSGVLLSLVGAFPGIVAGVEFGHLTG